MFFSIIIPLHNKFQTIGKTISSILEQKFNDFELIIVDDGSTDNSFEIVSRYKDSRIINIQKSNGGVSSARNEGLQHAKGDWIIFLDADDILLPEALSVFRDLIYKYPDYVIYAANYEKEYLGNIYTACKLRKEYIIDNPFKAEWFEDISLRAGSFVVKNNIMTCIRFDETLSYYEDHLVIRYLQAQYCIVYSPKKVMRYNQCFSSLSAFLPDLKKEWQAHYFAHNSSNFYLKLCSYSYINSSLERRIKAKDVVGIKLYNKILKEKFPRYFGCYFYILQFFKRFYNLYRKTRSNIYCYL